LIAAFDPERGALVVVPTFEGKRGNPVLWSRRFFTDLGAIEGDVGARHLIGRYGEAVVEVAVAGKAALVDVDTPEALTGVKAEIENALSK
jgi:molybdenum cofactor cytidylyltransferase